MADDTIAARIAAEEDAATLAQAAGDNVTAAACRAVADDLRSQLAEPSPAKKGKRAAGEGEADPA